jgi:hypothetical protein
MRCAHCGEKLSFFGFFKFGWLTAARAFLILAVAFLILGNVAVFFPKAVPWVSPVGALIVILISIVGNRVVTILEEVRSSPHTMRIPSLDAHPEDAPAIAPPPEASGPTRDEVPTGTH